MGYMNLWAEQEYEFSIVVLCTLACSFLQFHVTVLRFQFHFSFKHSAVAVDEFLVSHEDTSYIDWYALGLLKDK